MDCSLQGVERIGRITIHSKWLGFASPPAWWDDSEIVPDGDQFVVIARNRMTDPPGDEGDGPDEEPWAAVSPASVDRLLLAIHKPPLERPSPENLGLDSQALRPFASIWPGNGLFFGPTTSGDSGGWGSPTSRSPISSAMWTPCRTCCSGSIEEPGRMIIRRWRSVSG